MTNAHVDGQAASGDRYQTLLAISEAIVSHRDLSLLFHDLADQLRRVAGFDYLSLVMHEAASNTMRLHLLETSESIPPGTVIVLQPEEDPAGLVWQTQQPLITSSVDELRRWPRLLERVQPHRVESFCWLPLTTARRRLAQLVFTSKQPSTYNAADLPFLLQVANQVAVAVENAFAFEEIEALNVSWPTRREGRARMHFGRADDALPEPRGSVGIGNCASIPGPESVDPQSAAIDWPKYTSILPGRFMAVPMYRQSLGVPMKLNTTSNHRPLFRGFITLLGTAASCIISQSADAQIYVGQQGNASVGEYDVTTGTAINTSFITGLSTPRGIDFLGNNLFVASNLNNRVGEYNATTGAVINSSFISLNSPTGLLVSGNNLFVAFLAGGVGQYNASTGAAINSSFITGLSQPAELELSGNSLFVSDQGTGRVGLYNATTGAAINATFITFSGAYGLALSGNNLFVSTNSGTVGVYNASTGAAINSSFITGLNTPLGLAISGNNLFVANFGNGTVGEYNATTGAAINPSFITGLSSPVSIAVRPVPEPSTWAVLVSGISALLGARRRHRD